MREQYAKASLVFFMLEYLKMEVAEHHIEWSQKVSAHKHLNILAARGHGKSGFFSYAYVIWRMWKTAKTRGLLISDTADQVAEFLRIIKEGVEFRDPEGHVWKMPALVETELSWMVPRDYERTWTGERIVCTNGSRVAGKTFGKRFRGRHVPWIVIDDPHGDDASYSEVARERDWTFLKASIEPMLLNGGQMIIVGTPLHADDIHGRTAKLKDWHQASYPAITTDRTGKQTPLWPEFRPLSYLDSRRRSMGDLLFNQEYLLIPASSEASLFPRKLFLQRPETLAHWLKLGPRAYELEARSWMYVAGVDFALSAEAGADYTVITVLGVDDKLNRHLVELVRVKGMSFSQQLQLIEATLAPYMANNRLARVYVESNQAQRIFGDELVRNTLLPIFKFNTTGGEKHSLERGVPSLRVLFENGKMRLARGDAESIEITNILMAELSAFGWVNGKLQGVGSHDDCVMSLWIADLAARAGSAIRVWPEEQEDDRRREEDLVTSPLTPEQHGAQGHTALFGESGKALMIREGHVPETCTMPHEVAGPLIWREVQARRSPCWGCSADRAVCKGEPQRTPAADLGRMVPLVQVDEPREPERVPEAAGGLALGLWLEVVDACGGDRSLANIIPETREGRVEGWNSIMGGGAQPDWVRLALASGRGDALYEALRKLLKVGIVEDAA